jgi:hypothetical protein
MPSIMLASTTSAFSRCATFGTSTCPIDRRALLRHTYGTVDNFLETGQQSSGSLAPMLIPRLDQFLHGYVPLRDATLNELRRALACAVGGFFSASDIFLR